MHSSMNFLNSKELVVLQSKNGKEGRNIVYNHVYLLITLVLTLLVPTTSMESFLCYKYCESSLRNLMGVE